MRGRFAGGPAPEDGFPVPRSAPAASHLGAPATDRRALGQALAALRPRPVVTVGDLLEHTPFRHEDYRSERTLAEMAPGEEATVVCTVERVRVRPTRRRNLVIVEAAVRDESGPGVVIWFNQRYLAKQLRPGMRLSIRGERRPTNFCTTSREHPGRRSRNIAGCTGIWGCCEAGRKAFLAGRMPRRLHASASSPESGVI